MKKVYAKLLTSCVKNKQKRQLIRRILSNKIPYTSVMPKVPTGYLINGSNNRIIIMENNQERLLLPNERIPGLEIEINGNNNTIRLELPLNASNSKIEIGNDNVNIRIGSSNRFYSVYICCCLGDGQRVSIGHNITVWGANIICGAKTSCIIGDDCLFSNSIRIWCDDGHSILDKNTGEILNESKGAVFIGDHVWIGEGARITKNARIYNHSIVGGVPLLIKIMKKEMWLSPETQLK